MRAAVLVLGVVCACAAAVTAVAGNEAGGAQPIAARAATGPLRPSPTAPVARRLRTTAWCGTSATADRPQLVTGKAVHVVYAYPTDARDRFAEVVGRIQGDVELIERWWRGQDPTRSLRFDLTPYACGPQLDVTVVRLPETASVYYPLAGRYERVATALSGAGLVAKWAVYLVYLDGPAEGDACGQGGGLPDAGASFALVFLLGPCSELETVAAHEVVHGLGVAWYAAGAPHTCPDDQWHVCDSEQDLMSPFANDLFTRVLDVGRDDYYGHAGSWYDLQDSPWLKRPTQAHVSVTVHGTGTVRSSDPGIECSSATCESVWDIGIPVTLDVEAGDGMRFVRWEGSCSGDFCQLAMNGSAGVTALFAPETFALALTVTGKGAVTSTSLTAACRAKCRLAVMSYLPVKLTAKPSRGWRFRRWSGGCTHTRPSCTLPMIGPAGARATFVRR